MERPPARPEGALIRLAREAAGISLPDAARTSGVSKARWSQVESGYETRSGVTRPVQAKAATIAHMARAVGLSPERLETEGQRPDAAEILREILRNEPPPLRAVPAASDSHAADDDTDPAEGILSALLEKFPDDDALAAIAAQSGKAVEKRVREALRLLDIRAGIQGNGTTG